MRLSDRNNRKSSRTRLDPHDGDDTLAPNSNVKDLHSPDLDQTHAFLHRLGSLIGGEQFTFQTFDDREGKRRDLNRVLHGTLAQHGRTLARLNALGAGVFVMVNRGDGRGRAERNVTSVRALFVDLDGSPLEPVTSGSLQPHLVVESSPGRWHAYWLVQDVPISGFKGLQQALAKRFDGDRKVCDPPRVMRLPGFWHNKKSRQLTNLTQQFDGPAYTLAQMTAEFPAVAPVDRHSAKRFPADGASPAGERNDTLYTMASGFFSSGHTEAAVRRRLTSINTNRCEPPISATELDSIVASAANIASRHFSAIPHTLLDSPKWRSLPQTAKQIVIGAYRRYNGGNNGKIVLSSEGFMDEAGMSRSATFYRHRDLAVAAGFLIETCKSRSSQSGRLPAMFAIAAEFLHVPQASRTPPTEESVVSAKGKKRTQS